MTRNLALLAALGSAGMLLGAFAFEHLGDLPPCKMCIWQRWPHGLAAALGVVAWRMGNRTLGAICGLIVLVGAGIAFYHTGVEQSWWEGPSTCTSSPIGILTTEELLAQIQNAPLVRCDEIAWSLFGLSMAAWNGVISLGLAALWGMFARRA